MRKINGKLHIIRRLAAEGHYHIYSLLGQKKRVLLLIKLFLITIGYLSLIRRPACDNQNLVFIKGDNQFRLYNHYKNKIIDEIGQHQVLRYDDFSKCHFLFSLKGMAGFLRFIFIFSLIAVTGKRKYLNIFFLEFNRLLEHLVQEKMKHVKNFICFNDQPFDMVSLILNLHQYCDCNTAVVQHGLVLTEKFYFPTQAKQFWAWGSAVRVPFQRNNNKAELVIKGRYKKDCEDKKQQYINISAEEKIYLLIAPSYFHHQVKAIVKELKGSRLLQGKDCEITIKYHPATKLKVFLRLWMRLHWPSVKETSEDMESLSDIHHILVTKNSTSALDFMLKGKPVFFTEVNDLAFPKKDYAFLISEIEQFFTSEKLVSEKNKARLLFLKGELNV